MARSRVVNEVVSDDVDGSTRNVQTFTFSFEGRAYEIDLGPKNAKALRADMDKWTDHARKAKRSVNGRRRPARGSSRSSDEAARIRAWATENGVEVSSRGRIPMAVVEQYRNS